MPSQRQITAYLGATWKHLGKEEKQHKKESCLEHASSRHQADQGKLCCVAEIAAQIQSWGEAVQRAVHSLRVDFSRARAGGSRETKALTSTGAGDGEAALGTIKMHPLLCLGMHVCMYIHTETCHRTENFPRWTCMPFFP